MKILGRKLAQYVYDDVKTKVSILKNKNIIPKLVIIKSKNLDAVNAYIHHKIRNGELLGIKVELVDLKDDVLQDRKKIVTIVEKLNNDSHIHGIIFQKPSHTSIDDNIESLINPIKDVDGFLPNSKHLGPVYRGVKKVIEQTTQVHYREYMNNQQLVIIGKGKTGGNVVSEGLKHDSINMNNVKIIDSKTSEKDRKLFITNASIIISAVGKHNPIDIALLRKKHTLIDIGIHFDSQNNIKGDFDEEEIKDKVNYYTTTPGGIGQLTVAYLMDNLINASFNE